MGALRRRAADTLNSMNPIRSHKVEFNPTDLILRSRAQHGVSKGGHTHCGLWPPFETRARARSSGRG
jgi:hypothetical protein